MATRSEVLALVDGKQFDDLEAFQYSDRSKVATREDYNDGDGRTQYLTLKFDFKDGEPNLVVSLRGTYSSHGDSYWHEVFLSEPYTYTVTGYRKVGETA